MRNLVITTITFIILSFSAQSQDVLIYSDDGTWEDGIIALEHFFDYQNVTHIRLYAADLNADTWNKEALSIVFPGGYAYNYQLAISLDAVDEIRSYVANGGGFIGICAGAYFASKAVAWENEIYPYELALFDGMTFGSLKYIAPWPNYSMTGITINKNNPIGKDEPVKNSVLYYGGPIFKPNVGVEVDTIATWDTAENTLAIINFEYEKGKVLLIGPHLEIEESDDRDGTEFAAELDDVESDWGLLENGFKWLTNKTQTSVEVNYYNREIYIYPNPLNDYIYLEVSSSVGYNGYNIYNIHGENVETSNNASLKIDITGLISGSYILEITTESGKVNRQKFIKE
ncbi:MAG: BPL-N domain-containing protein [Candidatus Kapaibacterium sp.]